MMIETMLAVASSVVPGLAPSAPAPVQNAIVNPGAVVLPRSASVALTSLDGMDGKGTWLWHKTIGYDVRENIRVADRKSYPEGRADSVRRPGFNGAAWSGETVIGGVDSWAVDSGSPGAAAYGAVGQEDMIAHLRVGPYVIGVNPFEEIRAEGKEIPRQILAKMEEARNQWLRDHGYVGGVRTFMNDAKPISEPKQAIDLTPKAVIPAPTDLPKTRSKMEVRAAEPRPAVASTGPGVTRISAPPTVSLTSSRPPTLVAKQ